MVGGGPPPGGRRRPGFFWSAPRALQILWGKQQGYGSLRYQAGGREPRPSRARHHRVRISNRTIARVERARILPDVIREAREPCATEWRAMSVSTGLGARHQ